MCTIPSSELSTNHVGIKGNSCILSVNFPKFEFLTRRVYANAFYFARFEIQAFLKHE